MSDQRRYTVAELDDLRAACEMKWLYGSYTHGVGFDRSYVAAEKTVSVEALVRTHMLAGHTGAELRESEKL